jgi:hypothetical protein
VARGEDAAIGVVGVRAYTTGFELTLAIRLRKPRPPATQQALHLLLGGEPVGRGDPDERLLVGIEYADGRRTTNADGFFRPGQLPDPDALVLSTTGGGGGDSAYDQNYWLSPLPPEGPITVVCRCPAIGIPETVAQLDGAAIARAGRSSVVLWPPTPIETEPAQPPPPRTPPDGWFTQFNPDA